MAADARLLQARLRNGPIHLATQQLQGLFHSLSKVISSFVHTTCSLSVCLQYLAFAEIHLRFAQHYQTARLLEFAGIPRDRDQT